jgi:hypothetical protein
VFTTEVFGHASVAITGDIYGHVSPEVSREALTRLSDALSGKHGHKGGQEVKLIMKRSQSGGEIHPLIGHCVVGLARFELATP